MQSNKLRQVSFLFSLITVDLSSHSVPLLSFRMLGFACCLRLELKAAGANAARPSSLKQSVAQQSQFIAATAEIRNGIQATANKLEQLTLCEC